MRLGNDENGFKRSSFAEMYIYELIDRYETDYNLLLTTTDIANITGHSYQRINQILNNLIKEGMIKKILKFNPEDTRKIYYTSYDKIREEFNYYNYDKYLKSIKKSPSSITNTINISND